MPRKCKTKAFIFILCTWLVLDGSYQCWGVCVCVCMHVCIGNQESHLPQQIFPGDGGSQCTMIRNMICACTEHCCTWLICCTTCLCGDSFVCFCCIVRCWIVEASWGASAPMQDKRMVFESTGAVSYFAHHSLI